MPSMMTAVTLGLKHPGDKIRAARRKEKGETIMQKRALICGAGISGLSAGICLSRLGWEVTVFEKDDELRTVGTPSVATPTP